MFLFQRLRQAACCGSHCCGSITFGLLFRPEPVCLDSACLACRLNWISYRVCVCCQYTDEDGLFLKVGYCVGKIKCSSHSLRKCYGKGEKGRGWGWGQTQEHRESSGKVFLVIPVCWQWVCKSSVARAGEERGFRLLWPFTWLGEAWFLSSLLTPAALVSKKSVLRVLLPSHRCKLVSSLLKFSSRRVPLHHPASLCREGACGVSRRCRIRPCPNQAVQGLETSRRKADGISYFKGSFMPKKKIRELLNQNEYKIDEFIICCNMYVSIKSYIYKLHK